MAKQTEEVAAGVSQVTFDAHTHSYRKLTQVGADSTKTYATPDRTDVVDDSEVFAADNTDMEAVGVTVSTQPTGVPS